MIQVALVNLLGEVVSVVSAASDGAYGDGEIVGDLTAFHIDSDIDATSFINEKYWDGVQWQPKPEKPNGFYDWTAEATWVFNSEAFLSQVRSKRNTLLFQSDWTQLPDSNVDSAAWATYRQALRDFPSTIDPSTASLEDLVWPTSP